MLLTNHVAREYVCFPPPPTMAWVAGLILVGGAAFFPAKISFATFSTCSVIGQLTASLVLDGYVAALRLVSKTGVWQLLPVLVPA